MKNKIVTTIIGIIFSMFLIIGFAIPTYAEESIEGSTEANVILEKDANSDNKINVSLETSLDQSIASFNISLTLESTNVQDIKSVKMDWNSDISNNAELKEVTYSNSRINVYVVSKNELGNVNGEQKRINIGTITIETENNESINIVVRAQKDLTRIASIGHEMATITNDISTMVQLQIAPRVSSGNQGGDINSGEDNQGSGNSQGGSGNHSGNGTQGGNNSQDGDSTLGEDDDLNGDSDQLNNENKPDNEDITGDKNTEKENIAQGELPKAGRVISNIIIFSIIALGVLILITIIIIKAKARQSRHSNK